MSDQEQQKPEVNIDSIFATDARREVDVGRGVRFIIKTDFTYPEETRLAMLGQRVQDEMKQGGTDLDLLTDASLEMLRIAITGWKGVIGEGGSPVPFTREKIDTLRSEIALKIIQEITKVLQDKQSARAEWEKNKLQTDLAVPAGQGPVPAPGDGDTVRSTHAGPAESGGPVRPAGGLGAPGEARDAGPGAGPGSGAQTDGSETADAGPADEIA